MNTNDNENATKGDIRLLKGDIKEIRKEMSILRTDMRKEIREGIAHQFGLIKEFFVDQFKLLQEGFMDLPERTSKIEEKSQENDDEHMEFRIRIGALERN